jgi:hypothetical protein
LAAIGATPDALQAQLLAGKAPPFLEPVAPQAIRR